MRRRMPFFWRQSRFVLSALLIATTLQGAAPRPLNQLTRSAVRLQANMAALDERYQFATIEVPDGTVTDVYDINSRGFVAGTFVDNEGNWKTFTWYRGKVTSIIQYPGATYTSVVGIDGTTRTLVGNWGSDTIQHAGTYDGRTNSWTQFPDIPGRALNFAVRIVPNGLAVGETCDGNIYFLFNCQMWTWDGKTYEFFSAPGAGFFGTMAWNVNDHGQVIGVSFDTLDVPHAFLWQKGVFSSIEPAEVPYSIGYDINNAGQMLLDAGYPLLLDKGKGTKLPFYPGSASTLDIGMNERGDLVGMYYIDQDSYSRGFVAIRR